MADLKVTFPTLYKMDSKGKIRQWSITAWDEGANRCHYEQEHGLQDGKLQTTSTKVSKGKNIGKANETSAWEQCKLEAESLWRKQRDRKGYTEDIPTGKPKLPMLAHKFHEHKKKLKWPCYCQPKLDGIRCMIEVVNGQVKSIKSRTNKEFKVLSHIAVAVECLGLGTITLDGELYNHDFRDEFGELTSAIKRDEVNKNSLLIEYHVYDAFLAVDFEERHRILKESIIKAPYVKLVETTLVKSEDDFKKIYEKYLADGYEGGILRNLKGKYKENGRSYDLLKFKDFDDDEFEIVGAEENKGKMAGECTFICKTEDGNTFGVKPKGNQQVRRQYWEDFKAGKLTGKLMTVRYFGFTPTDKPVPRFPIGIAIRDYE